MLSIGGFTKTTLLDYPDRLAAMVFMNGCNFNCPFCHNQALLKYSSSTITEQEVLSHLEKRSSVLEGVCISGGEPTLYKEMYEFIKKIKEMGYLVKLDTNGSNPTMLSRLLEDSLLDYVAMDIKTDICSYERCSGTPDFKEEIMVSIDILKNCTIPFEFRTTVVEELHTEEDFQKIAEMIKGVSHYYLQPFRPCDGLQHVYHAPSIAFLKKIQKQLQKTIPYVGIRG